MMGKSVVVVGGGRGLGQGVARAAGEAGARVTAVARHLGGIEGVEGDATDPGFAEKVLAERRPELLVVTAGAVPEMRPLTGHTWESFSANWHADVRIAFTWLRAALRLPLAPGSLVVMFGSAAELRGSPLSGGYAGAKATVRMITGYAAAEGSELGIAMTTVLPVLTPGTTVGDTAIRAYAENANLTLEQFTAGLTNAPTPASIGRHVIGLAEAKADGKEVAPAYMADRTGLRPLD